MIILNLGCGTKTSPEVVNIDWSIHLRIKRSWALSLLARPFIKGERLERLKSLPDSVMVYNLSKGIPFLSDSIDAVYHSHFLEHLDKEYVEPFMFEVKRVLKPGGIHRIVVPDFEKLCNRYLQHIQLCDNDATEQSRHDDYIADIILQMVRNESSGTSQQPPFQRFVENLFLGDARKRGESHRWMYDRISLQQLLKKTGFNNSSVEKYDSSKIPNWNRIGLDADELNNQYRPESIYVEAIK